MTGNTTAVLIGLGLISMVLPIGILILARSYATIEREHPVGSDGARPSLDTADTGVPTPRLASASEAAAGRRTGAAVR